MWTTFAAGCVSSWNAGAERLYGYSAEEIRGQYFACFYPADDATAKWLRAA